MRIEDEFNQIEVKNDQQIEKAEFGHIQKNEYSENGDTGLGKRNKYSNLNQSSPAKEVETTVTTATSAASSSAASSATAIAATSTSVIAVASTVAIGAISVATGISVALHDYKVQFNSLVISSNELSYNLIINDLKKDTLEDFEYKDNYQFEEEISKNTFNLRVYNANYDKTEEVYLFYENSGSFTGLTLGQTYNIVLSENRYGGEILYNESFTTALNSTFLDFYLESSYDSYADEIYVSLDYIDELDSLSDFKLYLYRDEHDDIVIPIEKMTGRQVVSLSNLDIVRIEPEFEYYYAFSYMKDEEEIYYQKGEISFYDISEAYSEYYGFIFNKTADFATGEFEVQIDYRDDLDIYSDFNLLLTPNNVATTAPETITIPLKDVSEPQIINGFEYGLVYEGVSYSYELRCVKENEITTLETGEVTFTDTYGRVSQFNELIFDGSANYKENTFTLTLDYEDPFNYYDEFVLTMYMGPDDVDGIAIPLEKTTEEQTISAENYDINFKFSPYTYSLSCLYRGEETFLTSGDVTFTDISGAEVTFYGLTFEKKANFDTREFSLQLDYVDDLDSLYSFTFTLTDLDTSESKEFILDKTTDVQTFVVDEMIESQDGGDPTYKIDITQNRMSYRFEYYNDGELVVPVEGEEFYFENSLVSTFNNVETDYDFISEDTGAYMLPIRFDYDDAAHAYDYFNVSLSRQINDEPGFETVVNLMFEGENVSKDWQYAVPVLDGEYKDIATLCEADDLYLVVSYFPRETPQNPSPSEEVLFYHKADLTYDQTSSKIYGGTIRNTEMSGGSYGLDITPIYAGSQSVFECEIIVETKSNKTYRMSYELPSKGNYTTVYLIDSLEDQVDENTIDSELEEGVNVSLRYCTLSTNPDNPEEVIRSEYITLTLATNYVFVVQH